MISKTNRPIRPSRKNSVQRKRTCIHRGPSAWREEPRSTLNARLPGHPLPKEPLPVRFLCHIPLRTPSSSPRRARRVPRSFPPPSFCHSDLRVLPLAPFFYNRLSANPISPHRRPHSFLSPIHHRQVRSYSRWQKAKRRTTILSRWASWSRVARSLTLLHPSLGAPFPQAPWPTIRFSRSWHTVVRPF